MGKKKIQPQGAVPSVSSPSQQDEADILDEAGAERDEDSGDLVVSEDAVRELGAIDADSVRENRRVEEMVNKKRANVKDVQFNISDVIAKYDAMLKFWPANTLHVNVKRLTGTPVQHIITTHPRSGAELYEALRLFHGPNPEAEYELRFHDANSKTWRANGRITMPDARPPQQGQPMNPFYPGTPGYPPPAYGYPAPVPSFGGTPGAGPPQPPSPPPAAAAPAPPPPQWPPPAVPDPMAMMGQMFELFQRMQQTAQPQPQNVPPMPTPPPMPVGNDPAAMMTWMQQMFELFQQMRAQPQPQSAAAATHPGMPPLQGPPGTAYVHGIGFVPLTALAQAMSPEPPPRRSGPTHRSRSEESYDPPPAHAPPSYTRDRGPAGYSPPSYDGRGRYDDRGSYDERFDGRGRDGRGYPPHDGRGYPPQQQQQRQPSFRDAVHVIREAVDMAREVENLIPGRRGAEHVAEAPDLDENEESPIQVVDTGPAKIVLNKKDGSLRTFETAWANADKIVKFLSDQGDAIRQFNREKHRNLQQPPQQQQLPPGYVEVGPGYVPPAGYTAIPVDAQDVPFSPPQGGLPPPPEHVPPPVRSSQAWGVPNVPTRG